MPVFHGISRRIQVLAVARYLIALVEALLYE